ncbi:hypothetical protein AB0283_29815, partial [Micromonospora vinacea]
FSVPGDLSVVGFDNIPESVPPTKRHPPATTRRPLTTVRSGWAEGAEPAQRRQMASTKPLPVYRSWTVSVPR